MRATYGTWKTAKAVAAIMNHQVDPGRAVVLSVDPDKHRGEGDREGKTGSEQVRSTCAPIWCGSGPTTDPPPG
jgi:hypothetical protein